MTYLRHHIAYQESTHSRFFVVVLDIDVDDMNRLIVHGIPGLHIVDHMVVDALLRSDNQLKSIRTMLELFWFLFDASIAVEHVQQTVLCVAGIELKMFFYMKVI